MASLSDQVPGYVPVVECDLSVLSVVGPGGVRVPVSCGPCRVAFAVYESRCVRVDDAVAVASALRSAVRLAFGPGGCELCGD